MTQLVNHSCYIKTVLCCLLIYIYIKYYPHIQSHNQLNNGKLFISFVTSATALRNTWRYLHCTHSLEQKTQVMNVHIVKNNMETFVHESSWNSVLS